MKLITDNTARELMERFLDGATTLDEERELYRYFAQATLPADMETYRDMMGWYDHLGEGTKESVGRSAIRVRPWHAWASVAASVVVAAVVGVWVLSKSPNLDDEYLAYQGSYVIENGVKNTDIKEILPKLQAAEALADSYASQEFETDDAALRAALQGVTDPAERQMIIDAIND